jgi:signal peptidase II
VGFLVPAAIVILLDQITKLWVWGYFHVGHNVDVVPGVLRITLVRNTGAAFGFFEGGRVFFIVTGLIAVGFILYLGFRVPKTERYKRLLLGLILGGAIGNLIDRVYNGAVIDFIEMGVNGHWWPVYNVADIAVSVGAALLLFHLVRTPGSPQKAEQVCEPGESREASRPQSEPPTGGPAQS